MKSINAIEKKDHLIDRVSNNWTSNGPPTTTPHKILIIMCGYKLHSTYVQGTLPSFAYRHMDEVCILNSRCLFREIKRSYFCTPAFPLRGMGQHQCFFLFFLGMYILLYLLSSGSFRVKSISFLDECIQRKYIFVLFQNDGGKISMNDGIVLLLLIHRKLEILINKGLIRYSMYVEHLSQLSGITRGLPIVCKEKFVV